MIGLSDIKAFAARALDRVIAIPSAEAVGHDEHRDESSQSVRILVVDDDPLMSQMVVNYLEDHHLRTLAASDRYAANP